MNTQEYTIAEVKLIYKTTVKSADRPIFSSSSDAFLIFDSWDKVTIEHIEEFKIML